MIAMFAGVPSPFLQRAAVGTHIERTCAGQVLCPSAGRNELQKATHWVPLHVLVTCRGNLENLLLPRAGVSATALAAGTHSLPCRRNQFVWSRPSRVSEAG